MMDTLPGPLIFNRKELIVTNTTSRIKAVSSCLIKYVFIVILLATTDCPYKIDKNSKSLLNSLVQLLFMTLRYSLLKCTSYIKKSSRHKLPPKKVFLYPYSTITVKVFADFSFKT